MKKFINIHMATNQDMIDPNINLWNWDDCIGCGRETPHTHRIDDKVCQDCSETRLI